MLGIVVDVGITWTLCCWRTLRKATFGTFWISLVFCAQKLDLGHSLRAVLTAHENPPALDELMGIDIVVHKPMYMRILSA